MPMLKNDFYICRNEKAEDNEISCQVVYNAGHAIFRGHFPGNPVVPGVCMIEMVKELLQERVQEGLLLRSSGNIKFLTLITPEISPVVKIDWEKIGDDYHVKASIYNDTTVFFKFDGKYSIV